MQNADNPCPDVAGEQTNAAFAADFPAYILCGGKSARFGTDKARITIDRQPHLLRLAKSLRKQGHETHFVSDRVDRFKDLGIATIVDAKPECGPMAGLVAAARHRESYSGGGWFLLLSCDQLRWQPKYFHWLAECITDRLNAVTYGDPFVQPIPGLYHTRIEAIAEAALAARQLSLKRMLESDEMSLAIEKSENPREWCFNSKAELNQLLEKLQQEFEL
jgi:molybdenum cofactor guanylyltransferase